MADMLLKNLVAAHMMRSVSERYALLQRIGCSFDHISRYNLEDSPRNLAVMLLGQNGLLYWEGKESGDEFIKNMIAEPLPEGIIVPTI